MDKMQSAGSSFLSALCLVQAISLDKMLSWGQLGDYLGAISVLAEKELQRNLIEYFA